MIRFGRSDSGRCVMLVAVAATLAAFACGQEPGESQDGAVSHVDSPITEFGGFGNRPAVDGLPLHDFSLSAPLSVRLEYLCWWMNGHVLPPLVTTGPPGTPPVLGLPTTRVLFGDEKVDASNRSGFRVMWDVRLAHWFETDLQLEGHFFWLGHGQDSGDFFAESTGVPVLGRPFRNLQTSSQDALLVAAPGLPFPDPLLGMPDPSVMLDLGRMEADSSSHLNAAGVLLRKPWVNRTAFCCDLLAGYRYLGYREGLTLQQSQFFSDPTDPTDPDRFAEIHIEDSFSTWSEFHGVDLGIEAHVPCGPLELELLGKLAVGNVHQILTISGNRLAIRPEDGDPNTPQVVAQGYGFLATPSTVGRYAANHFGVVPEIGVTLRWPVACSFSITLGYTLLALPNVLRAGDQIDTAIDPSHTIPGAGVALNDSTVWIQGINVGVEF